MSLLDRLVDAGHVDQERFERDIAQIKTMITSAVIVELTDDMAWVLAAEAALDERTVEYIARKVIKDWADGKLLAAKTLHEALTKVDEKRAFKASKDPRTERDFEKILCAALLDLGLSVDTQVNTGAGIADIVIYEAEKPLAVIEVKLVIKNWRDFHQAVGQAEAYAKAIKAPMAFATAPSIERKLIGNRAPKLIAWDGAAEAINRLIGNPHVITLPKRQVD